MNKIQLVEKIIKQTTKEFIKQNADSRNLLHKNEVNILINKVLIIVKAQYSE